MTRIPKVLVAVLSLAAIAIGGCGSSAAPHDGGGGGSGGGGAGGSGGSGTGGSGAGGTTGAGGTGGAAGTGGTTGTGGTGGGVPCGGVSCRGDQLCVHPSCGGGAAVCVPLGDAGQCPSGWAMTDQCSPGSGPGCVPPPCTPPPPRCVDIPAACSGAPTCNCLPSSVCTQSNGQYGGSCGFVSEANVTCLSA